MTTQTLKRYNSKTATATDLKFSEIASLLNIFRAQSFNFRKISKYGHAGPGVCRIPPFYTASREKNNKFFTEKSISLDREFHALFSSI